MHITLSGSLGSGKSTVCQQLQKRGYEVYSTGKILRRIAESLGLTALEMNELAGRDHHFDLEIDREVVRLATQRPNDDLVFDSRMAWHFVPVSYKVFLTVDSEVAAKRVFTDGTRGFVEHYQSTAEAAAMLATRRREEHERFRSLYGVDYLDMRNYDLVIDTTRRTPEEVAEMILSQATQQTKRNRP